MQDKSTVQNLLDTSIQIQLAYIPFILEGRFRKRISKEEIKGWSSTQPPQLCQKQSNHRTQLESFRFRDLNAKARKSFNVGSSGKVTISKELKSAKEGLAEKTDRFNTLFKTFEHLPDISSPTLQTKIQKLQIQKIDFIKGNKMDYPPQKAKTSAKPLFETFASKKENNKAKTIQYELLSNREAIRSSPKQQGISIICYPIDKSQPQENSEAHRTKTVRFWRKHKRLLI